MSTNNEKDERDSQERGMTLTDRAYRTELQVVADTVWRLVQKGLIPERAPVLLEAVRAVGISVADLKEASIRLDQPARYRPPVRLPPRPGPIAADVARPAGENSPRRPATRHRRQKDGQMFCARHDGGEGGWLDPESFAPRADRPGARKSWCRDCLREYQRVRFLTATQVGLIRAGQPLVLDDRAASLMKEPCGRCGLPFVRGQEVEAVDVVVAHRVCP